MELGEAPRLAQSTGASASHARVRTARSASTSGPRPPATSAPGTHVPGCRRWVTTTDNLIPACSKDPPARLPPLTAELRLCRATARKGCLPDSEPHRNEVVLSDDKSETRGWSPCIWLIMIGLRWLVASTIGWTTDTSSLRSSSATEPSLLSRYCAASALWKQVPGHRCHGSWCSWFPVSGSASPRTAIGRRGS